MEDLMHLRIKSFELLEYNVIKIKLNDSSVFIANIESFNSVYCYPKNLSEWEEAKIGECAIDLEWSTGFGIHLDQIIPLALQQKKSA
jgi:hypothetical protein